MDDIRRTIHKHLAEGKTPALVFGLFETGLGVIRSLGQQRIPVIGIDYKKDIAWYSRYVKPYTCPHPLSSQKDFIQWVLAQFGDIGIKLPVFFTSDDFLSVYSANREQLAACFSVNMLPHSDLIKISDKYEQYRLALKTGVDLPKTFFLHSINELDGIVQEEIQFPVFVKGLDVLSWRKEVSSTVKGYHLESIQELRSECRVILSNNVPLVIQELIEGPDNNHYKYCCYISKEGRILAEFTLQKIRQNPVRFGVGAVVESIEDRELIQAGRALFNGIEFVGIGSAEFKRDEKDGKLKLIEINPRYWQQNYLSTACGINFPYLNYCELTGKPIPEYSSFTCGIKWVNRYMDFDSFLSYRREGSLSFRQWRKSLRGPKIYPDFTWSDPLPAFYEIGFGMKLLRIPVFLIKKLRGR